jgi:hypothetical protein
MTREEIIRMAREAGFADGVVDIVGLAGFAIFAALVAAHEREECAKVVETYCGAWDDQGYALAAAIRTRGEK